MRRRLWIGDGDCPEEDGKCGGATVYEPEDASDPRWTGLFDRHGQMICREPEPIGFRLGRRP